jgi:hypothetical protein
MIQKIGHFVRRCPKLHTTISTVVMNSFTGISFDGKKSNKVPIWDVNQQKSIEVQKSHYTIIVSKSNAVGLKE